MKSLLTILAATALAGCAVVPASTAMQACQMLQIASDEADLAPAWYISAGQVLERCGVPEARERAEQSACAAERRNGYDCEAQP